MSEWNTQKCGGLHWTKGVYGSVKACEKLETYQQKQIYENQSERVAWFEYTLGPPRGNARLSNLHQDFYCMP